MKYLNTLVLAMTALAGVTAAVPAHAFSVPVALAFTPYAASIQVFNPTGYPISCAGQVGGIRQDGLTQYTSFTLPAIPPGLSEYAYVNNLGPYYFVNVAGWADCGYGW